MIYDNSKKIDNQASYFDFLYPQFHFHYIHDELNSGLGVAYNTAAVIAKNIKKEFLIFLDQDTFLSDEYFKIILKSVNDNPSINLFSPVVISNEIVISPSSFFAGRSWVKNKKEFGQLKTINHTIINSGTVIRSKEFNLLGGYSTSLPLDFSDHYFFYKFKKRNRYFYVMPLCIQHHLSTFYDKDYNKVFNRFKIYYSAAIYFALNTKNFISMFWAFLHALKLGLVYKRFSFINHAFSIFKKYK